MPSKEDAEQFVAMGDNVPNVETHPNAFAWHMLVARFTEAVRGSWAAAAAPAADKGGKKKGGQAEGGKGKGKNKGKGKGGAQAAAEEDEMDLFGDDPEADAAAA